MTDPSTTGVAPPPILPGATIGIFGSGQLGRMLALVARRMGYRVATFGDAPGPDGRRTPTGQLADLEVVADFDDVDALGAFLEVCDVVTYEFENVPAAVAERAEAMGVPARPSGRVLATCQDRAAEKRFLAETAIPTVAVAEAPGGAAELAAAVAQVGYPAVVKTAAFGYDGKGQWRLTGPADLAGVAAEVGEHAVVVEELVTLAAEISVIVARGIDGQARTYPAIQNAHLDHILDWSACPAAVDPAAAATADGYARRIAEAVDLVGVLAVELFLTGDGRVLVNELAPRPHNSGHLTIEACPTSQFEQQLRAVCGLSLGATEPFTPAAMANLLGDRWAAGEPDWAALLGQPGVALHLYDKGAARPGRKLGHLTAVDSSSEAARLRVVSARRLACGE